MPKSEIPVSKTSDLSGKRLGIVLPSSNTVVEPLAAQMLVGTGVTAHFSRLEVIDVALDRGSRAQFALQRHVEAAKLLADAKVDAIVWGGTSASWLGPEHDRAFCDAVEAATGIRTTSCVLAMNRLLRPEPKFRLGLVTPYTDDVHAQIVENYRAMGYSCDASENHGGALSSDFADLSPQAIATMVRKVAAARPDVIFIMCTNLRGAAVAAALSAELGLTVTDSAAITISAGLELLNRNSATQSIC
uniref:maleate cis-trans isomerase family protein n=1 Tax=Pararhizobium sp. IMCC3301 TaxID=3067904 RepID=UPI00274059BB|nr:aspartate/glutamate racemase family protein [Pararhizobium sp. IMCC3301]